MAEVRGVVDTQGFLQFRVTRHVAADAEAGSGIATFLDAVLEPVSFRSIEIGAECSFQVRVLVQVEGGIQNRQVLGRRWRRGNRLRAGCRRLRQRGIESAYHCQDSQ